MINVIQFPSHAPSKTVFFICKNCYAEWLADYREYRESLPYIYKMRCPFCKKITIKKELKGI